MNALNFAAVSTEIGLAAVAVLIFAADLVLKRETAQRVLAPSAALLLALVLVFTNSPGGESLTFTGGLFIVDDYAVFFKELFIFAVVITMLYSQEYAAKFIRRQGEFLALLVTALIGMCVIASANDFLTAFVGLETMTISFYVLAALLDKTTSSEAAIKYLVVGAASTATMLFGISLIYGAGASLVFAEISASGELFSALGLVGASLVLAGFGFKLSLIPFHMWAPDVYQGAPTPITALLAMGSKAAAIALFMRVLTAALPTLADYYLPLVAALSALSIIGGNIMALKQTDVKRMLAYSSIAQAGYMLAGLSAGGAAGVKAVMFYITLYIFANIGAFVCLVEVEQRRGGTRHACLHGLAAASPLLAAVMTVCLLSMAGIPPTAGFAGKIYLFSAAIDSGRLWLAAIGFVLSMISVYYYLMVVKAMYQDLSPSEAEMAEKFRVYPTTQLIALVALALTLLIGIWPEFLSTAASEAAEAICGIASL